jgi:hypothetical protein
MRCRASSVRSTVRSTVGSMYMCSARGPAMLRARLFLSTEYGRLAGAALIPSGVTWHAASTYSSTGHLAPVMVHPPGANRVAPVDAGRTELEPARPARLMRPGIIACNFSILAVGNRSPIKCCLGSCCNS